jgi:hypothetical protein
LHIEDSAGNVIYDVSRERLPATNAIDERIAYIITDILSDNASRSPAMGAFSALRLPFPAAAKTGTTNDYRDNWALGYTPGLVVGVWSGNADGQPMRDSSGLFGAAPIWANIMQGVYNDPAMQRSLVVNGLTPPAEFVDPGGIVEQEVCLPRGTGGSSCTASRTDLFLFGAPVHGIGRLGYTPDTLSQPGAWRLAIAPLASEQAQVVWQSLPALADGARPPQPTQCVLNVSRPADNVQTRLMLPVPPFYPDEVRARLWARQYGYSIAPATACPVSIARAFSGSTAAGNGGDGGAPGLETDGDVVPVGSSGGGNLFAQITSPAAGDVVGGVLPIMGSATFGSGYYKLEISGGQGWTTLGNTHSTSVSNGVLEQLHAAGLSPGAYTLRLVIVGPDGNYAATHSVGITVQ